MNPIIIIPARMAATRLPGKPLADIGGRRVIVHVLERAREAGIGPVAVAAGEPEIVAAVEAAGGRAVLVADDVPSGTDRIHRALAQLDPFGAHDVVVNLQGDFPTLAPDLLWSVLKPLADKGTEIGTLVCPIADETEANTSSFVKAACAFPGESRWRPPSISAATRSPGEGPRWHHIGVYAYRRAALDRFVRLPRSRWSGARSWNSSARWKPACASARRGSTMAPSAWTRLRIWSARAPPGNDMNKIIAFQGVPGAYSDLACRRLSGWTTLPSPSFEAAMNAVREGRAELAMLPCENSLAGRVPDIHRLLPESGLWVVGEHFERVEHCLLVRPGTPLSAIRRAHSHPVALGPGAEGHQGAEPHPGDPGGHRRRGQMIARDGTAEDAAIASELAAEIYGLDILRRNVEDASHNTTRFYVVSREQRLVPAQEVPHPVTTFVFRVRNMPAALYKALGGFATNGVNMTKLESYAPTAPSPPRNSFATWMATGRAGPVPRAG